MHVLRTSPNPGPRGLQHGWYHRCHTRSRGDGRCGQPGGAALGPRSSNVIRLLGAGLLEKELLDNGGLLSSSLVAAMAVAPAIRTVSIDEDDIADMFHLKNI